VAKTTKQKILKYLDKVCRDMPITPKRISSCADIHEVIPIKTVIKVMNELVEAGEWETIKCWSSDGHRAYRRIDK
jgi:hypothetical protein